MKRIASFMTMLMLCAGAFAQATEWAGLLIKAGTAQSEMVPGKWYLVHNSRNPDAQATAQVMPGEPTPDAGGYVQEKGIGNGLKLTTTDFIFNINDEAGISANENMDKLVRFVPVNGVEGAYNIQFGTGNYLSADPKSGTVSRNQYLAGQAGSYNFYLITINGEPNQAGRFGWNKYDMDDRMDNNGAGNNVTFYGSGERIASDSETGQEDGSDIRSNNVWQLFDIVACGTEDAIMTAFEELMDMANEIREREEGRYADNLRAGKNVGHDFGNYLPEDVAEFLAYYDQMDEILLNVDKNGIEYVYEVYPSADEIKAFHAAYKAADDKMRANRVSRAATDIQPGYYTINTAMQFYTTRNDTVRYTQSECDEYNTENGYEEGDDGYITTESIKDINQVNVKGPVKALRSMDSSGTPWLAWGTLEPKPEFLWKIERSEKSDKEYRVTNMHKGMTVNDMPFWGWVVMAKDDNVTWCFDRRDSVPSTATGEMVITYSIRCAHQGTEDSGNNINAYGHENGYGNWNWASAWYGNTLDTRWYLSPVDEETAENWLNDDEVLLRKMLTKASEITGSIPEQLQVSKDRICTITSMDSVIVNASQITANSTTVDSRYGITPEETFAYLLDGNPATYWHSQWEGGIQPMHSHYLQIEANEPVSGTYVVRITRRAIASNDHPVRLAVRGYDEVNSELGFEDGDSLGVIAFPFSGDGKTDFAYNTFTANGQKVLRFYWEDSNGSNDKGFWHASGFNIFPGVDGTVHEKTQYQARQEIADRIQKAIDAWLAGGYSISTPELVHDPDFLAVYNELLQADEAWKAVYVNPSELRAAINSVPGTDLLVRGSNPGQWSDDAYTPTDVLNRAKAYDEGGAYTPQESQDMIQALGDAVAKTMEAANKVEAGKWYRIKFPEEDMYDTYQWNKASACNVSNPDADIEISPALFGKTVAAGQSIIEYEAYTTPEDIEDTLSTYQTGASETLCEGNGLFFFDDDQMQDLTQGEELFRFIPATEGTFIIQNKATGLFLRGGNPAVLSAVPTYFSTRAIGAGASIISYTTVTGERPSAQTNLHGQRMDNSLVCREDDNLGSNSALLIEEAGTVAQEPSTEYTTYLWPGTIYACNSPVDVSIIGDEACAYGAELEIADGADTAVVLRKIEADVIKAGTPYLLIADDNRDVYITPETRLQEIAREYIEAGAYGYYEKQEAMQRLQEEYVPVAMNHGLAVDTLQKGLGHLVGTLGDTTVKAGKAIVAKDNGFVHTFVDTTVPAYSAYLQSDFDAESADVLGSIVIRTDGSIETSVSDMLGKVAASGNIYTVDGKFVGKGNINAINALPAGIYIINGVKVTKN